MAFFWKLNFQALILFLFIDCSLSNLVIHAKPLLNIFITLEFEKKIMSLPPCINFVIKNKLLKLAYIKNNITCAAVLKQFFLQAVCSK